MSGLPHTDETLVLRTDFSSDQVWEEVCLAISTPVGDFRANVSCVSDVKYAGKSVEQLVRISTDSPDRTFLFVVDRETIAQREHPVLVIDLCDDPGRTFRVIPREIWGVENNLTLANMDFVEFADSVDADGVFRGFE